MSDVIVDAEALRADVRDKYRGVAAHPGGVFHFHTGRTLAARLGYDPAVVDALPDRAVEAFAGVANPFSLRPLQPGERVVDLGSGVRVRLLRRRRSRGRRGPGGRGWADVVISNGVFNPCPDRRAAFREARRVPRPGGLLHQRRAPRPNLRRPRLALHRAHATADHPMTGTHRNT